MTDDQKRGAASDLEELVRRAQQEARRARDDAQRAKDEALRLRNEARDLARKIRDEVRDDHRKAREEAREFARSQSHHTHGGRAGRGPWGPGPGAGWSQWFSPSAGAPGGPGAGASGSQPGEQSLSLEGIDSIHISQTAGKLSVGPCGEGNAPTVRAWAQKAAPRLDIQRDGSKLRIDIQVPRGWLFGRGNGATGEVRLPASLNLIAINLGAGELSLSQLTARRCDVHMGAGSAVVDALVGELHADMGAGRLSITNHRGLVRCAAGTGNVTVDIAELAAGDYIINSGVGRAEIRLPAGQLVTFRANKGLGRTRIEYPDAGVDAPSRIRLDAGVGEVIVKARRPGEAPATTAPDPKARPIPTSRRREADELRILEMLEQGKITSREAAELIAALHGAAPGADPMEEPPVRPTEETAGGG